MAYWREEKNGSPVSGLPSYCYDCQRLLGASATESALAAALRHTAAESAAESAATLLTLLTTLLLAFVIFLLLVIGQE